MLPLPLLPVDLPRDLEGALAALAAAARDGQRARVVAGGTDLLPNLKRGQLDDDARRPHRLVSLAAVRGLDGLAVVDGALRLGALTKLAALARSPLLRERAPAIARAASLIASPQIREMGTLGGNLCLDTRCRHVNQSSFFRAALGNCIKAPAERAAPPCHVVKGGRSCVASSSADLPPLLIALGATARLASAAGARTIELAALYGGDGAAPLALAPDELLVEIVVPLGAARAAYQKLRARAAIDFPLLGVAVALETDAAGLCRALRVVAAGTTPAPRVVGRLDELAVGRRIDREVAGAIAERCRASLHPLTTLGDDTAWRRAMIPVLVRRAFAELGVNLEGGI